MGQLHFHPVSLQELVARAPLIVVGRLASPPRREVRLPIRGRAQSGKRPPPFVHVLTRLRVSEVVRGDAKLVGRVLEVEDANAQAMLRLHTEYELRGLSRSPIFDRHEEGVPLDGRTNRLVFLHAGRRFSFVVSNAVVDRSRRAEVDRLLSGPEPG